ncbi:MAG: hypothetical protein U0871_29520 [Gemmataceae bacterium]
MTALLLTATLLIQPPQPPTGAGGSRETGTTGRNVPDRGPIAQPATTSIDGTWTVVAFERNGQPVADTAGMTVTVRNNVATFSGGGGRDAGVMPMRFATGSLGTVMVTMGDGPGAASGAGGNGVGDAGRGPSAGTGSGTGAGTGQGSGAGTGGSPTGAGSATTGDRGTAGRMSATTAGVRTGVMVMTRDYVALSVFDRPSVLPGSTGTAADRAVGGTGTTGSGTAGSGTAGGRTDPNVRPAGGSDRDTRGDRMTGASAERPAVVLILRRSGDAGRPGGR